jgi:hypothetical protein
MIERKRKLKENASFCPLCEAGREIDTEHIEIRQGLSNYRITTVLTSQIVWVEVYHAAVLWSSQPYSFAAFIV